MTEVAVRPEEAGASAGRRAAGGRDTAGLVFAVLLGVAVAASIGVRFAATKALWLDEAQSVAIARLPLTGPGTTLWTGLRQDGSPPLYYLLLHGWIALFGTGTSAVRSLSAILNIAAAAPLYVLARRVVGQRAARVSVLLYLTSPFALYFATETRMYSLVVLLTALGGLALERTLQRPSARSVAALALCSGLLALTHYWCLYLLLTVGGWLLGLAAARRAAPVARRALAGVGGIAAGAIVFSPWFAEFRYQAKHTGTPWGQPASFAAVAHAYGEWAGGATTEGRLLLLIVTALVAFGMAGQALDGRHILVDLHGREPGRTLFFVSTMTLVVAVAVGQLVGNAWADRYTSTAFVPFLLVVGLGATMIVDRRVFRAVVSLAAVLGLYAGTTSILHTRTQAGEAGAVLRRVARPGDVLLVCPDQLGPALARTVPSWLRVHLVPTYAPPDRVDWVDYAKRNKAANGVAIADRALAEAGPGHAVFFAGSGSYLTYETLCTVVRSELGNRRPTHAAQVMDQAAPADANENFALIRYATS